MCPSGNIVGPQVSRLRQAQQLSQAALAARCQLLGWDVSREILARVEGRIRCVTDAELVVLAQALASSIEELFPKSVIGTIIAAKRKAFKK